MPRVTGIEVGLAIPCDSHSQALQFGDDLIFSLRFGFYFPAIQENVMLYGHFHKAIATQVASKIYIGRRLVVFQLSIIT